MLRKFAMFGVLAVIAAGCAGPGTDGDAANYQSKSQFDKVGGKRDASDFLDAQDGNATRVAAGNFMPSTGARVEIRGASLDVRVANLDDSEKRVQQIIKQSGGYEQAL